MFEKNVEIHSAKSVDTEDSEIYVETLPHTWKGKIWDSWDKDKEERWFLFKLDFLLMFIGGSGVFLRYLDQKNINNAFVSGMKEELNLYGNELNYANACWSIGYAIGQIPSNLLLAKISKPHYYIAFLEISWSILTFCSASFSIPASIYAIRFFVGLFEAGHFPGIMYITSSWYTKRELSKRMSIIQFNVSTGPLISSFLQTAAYTGLNGVSGRAGWRWLFIIDGIISLPLALSVLIFLPDIPRTQAPNWIFSEKEIKLARKRVPVEAKVYASFSRKQIWGWFNTWHLYFFTFIFVLESLIVLPSSSLIFWFKSYNSKSHTEFSIAQINNYSAPVYAITIVCTVISGMISDGPLKGRRWVIVSFNCFYMFIICIALIVVPVHPEHKASRWAIYYLIGVYSIGAQAWTWVNESTLGDPAKRAFVGAVMNAVAYAFGAFVPIIAFPTQDQPFVTKGNIMCCVLAFIAGVLALVGAYIESLKLKDGFFQSAQIEVPLREDDMVESTDYTEKG